MTEVLVYPYRRRVDAAIVVNFSLQETHFKEYVGFRYEFDVFASHGNHRDNRVWISQFNSKREGLDELARCVYRFYSPIDRLVVVQQDRLPKEIGFDDKLLGNELEPVSQREYKQVVKSLQRLRN